MEVSCFTILCWFLPYNINQPICIHTHTHIYLPSPLSLLPTSTPHPSSLGLTELQAELPVLHINFPVLCSVASVMSDSCNPIDSSPPGFSVHGIFQARILKWVAISFSRGSSQPREQTHVSFIAGRFFTAKSPGNSNFPLVIYSAHVNACISVLLS